MATEFGQILSDFASHFKQVLNRWIRDYPLRISIALTIIPLCLAFTVFWYFLISTELQHDIQGVIVANPITAAIFIMLFVLTIFGLLYSLLQIIGHWLDTSTPVLKQLPDTHLNVQGLRPKCKNYFAFNKLHYIGVFDNKQQYFSDHILDEEKIQSRFPQTPEEQLQHYDRIGIALHGIVSSLNRRFRNLEQGWLIKIGFDVQAGAIFYHHTEFRDLYIVGTTTDQTRIRECDDYMEQLVDEIRQVYGLPPINKIRRKVNEKFKINE